MAIAEVSRAGIGPPNAMCDTIVNPILMMEREHEIAAEWVAIAAARQERSPASA